MLTRYLTDIEELLSVGDEMRALRAAVALPLIATALADDALHSSCEQFIAWCRTWVGEDTRELYGSWCGQAACNPTRPGSYVPVKALQQLRLCRHARPTSPGVRPKTVPSDPDQSTQVASCLMLVRGTRRWYTQEAVCNEIVQSNLARLAVLR